MTGFQTNFLDVSYQYLLEEDFHHKTLRNKRKQERQPDNNYWPIDHLRYKNRNIPPCFKTCNFNKSTNFIRFKLCEPLFEVGWTYISPFNAQILRQIPEILLHCYKSPRTGCLHFDYNNYRLSLPFPSFKPLYVQDSVKNRYSFQ